MEKEIRSDNPLGYVPENKLLRQFAIPSIIAMLVSSLYNIVDQFFIGNAVGELGNAATNIAFPLNTSCVAIALLMGIGGASTFNLSMGRGDSKGAGKYIGNSATVMLVLGVVLSAVTLLFLAPLLRFFGSPEEVLPYAMEYTRITALGFPFLILSTGGGHLVRADGSPKMTMAINIVGAVVNTVLDAIFVFGFGWGMTGAAAATVIGQVIASIMVIVYLSHYKTVPLHRDTFLPKAEIVLSVVSLGAAPCFNQLAMMLVQIVLNRTLKYYGGLSIYYPDRLLRYHRQGIHDRHGICHRYFPGLAADRQFQLWGKKVWPREEILLYGDSHFCCHLRDLLCPFSGISETDHFHLW